MQNILDLNLLDEKVLTNEITKDLVNELPMNLENEVLKGQENFLNSTIGTAINFGLDIGLKAVLPDVIEDLVIEIKDVIFREGFKEGLGSLVQSIKDIGKSITGIATGKFENINQIDVATKSGGVINTVSKLLNLGIDKAIEKEFIDPTMGSIIRSGKTAVLSSFSNKLEDSIKSQFRTFEKLESQMEKWEINLENKELDKMQRNINNINNYNKILVPFEDILLKSKEVNIIHNWVKENKSFDIPEELYDLIKKI